jgi:tRNA(fMet)-specific endonuclease VapC
MGEQTALFYARIYSDLKRAGTPIPTGDVWIAASSMEAGEVLITSDAHFQHIAGLLVRGGA